MAFLKPRIVFPEGAAQVGNLVGEYEQDDHQEDERVLASESPSKVA